MSKPKTTRRSTNELIQDHLQKVRELEERAEKAKKAKEAKEARLLDQITAIDDKIAKAEDQKRMLKEKIEELYA